MAMFNSYDKLPEGMWPNNCWQDTLFIFLSPNDPLRFTYHQSLNSVISFIRLDFQVVASASDGGTPSLATIFPMVVKTLVYPALLSSPTCLFRVGFKRCQDTHFRMHQLDIQNQETQNWGWFLFNIHCSDAKSYHNFSCINRLAW